jgi:hypothetical protein
MLDTVARNSFDGPLFSSYEVQWYHYGTSGAWTGPRFDGSTRSLFMKVLRGTILMFVCLDSDVAATDLTNYCQKCRWTSFLLQEDAVV